VRTGLNLGNGVSEDAKKGIVGIGEGFGGRNGFGNLWRRRGDLGGGSGVIGGFGCGRRRHENSVRTDFSDGRWRRRFRVNRHFVGERVCESNVNWKSECCVLCDMLDLLSSYYLLYFTTSFFSILFFLSTQHLFIYFITVLH